MKNFHDKAPRRRVAEPVQVYLRPREKERLDRLTAELDTTKSDVLRRGLEALELQVSDPEHHPALRIIGMVSTTDDPGVDVAREHDEYLAATEIGSWSDHAEEPADRAEEPEARAEEPGRSDSE